MNVYRVKITIRSMEKELNQIHHVLATSVEVQKEYNAKEEKQFFQRCIRRSFLEDSKREPEMITFVDEIDGLELFEKMSTFQLNDLKNNYYDDAMIDKPTWTLEYNEFKVVGNQEVPVVEEIKKLLEIEKYSKLSNNELIELESTL
ncbi:MAG: hypothetical protein KH135_00115 [Firmicutes bacterium]|nr:hypothetical protein [Bacillota bacterium]